MNAITLQESLELTKAAFAMADEALRIAEEAEIELQSVKEELESRAVEKQAAFAPDEQVKSAAETLCESGLLAEDNKEAFVSGIKDGGVPSLLSVLEKVAKAKTTVEPTGSFVPAINNDHVDTIEDEDALWRSTLD